MERIWRDDEQQQLDFVKNLEDAIARHPAGGSSDIRPWLLPRTDAEERGQVAVLLALTLPSLFLFFELVVVYPWHVEQRMQAQTGADAAALAAARSIQLRDPDARDQAVRFCVANGGELVDFGVSDQSVVTTCRVGTQDAIAVAAWRPDVRLIG